MAAYEHDEEAQSWDIAVDDAENQCGAAIEALERALGADSESGAQAGLSVVRLIFAAEAMECIQHIDAHVASSSASQTSVSVTQYFSYISYTSTGLTVVSEEQEAEGRESEQATTTISTPAAPRKTFQEALAEYATTQHKERKNTHAVKRRLATVRGLLASPASKGSSLSVAADKANVVYVTPTIVMALLIFVPLLIFFACASTWTMGIRVPPRLTTTKYSIGKES
jgi:hypothetical protein